MRWKGQVGREGDNRSPYSVQAEKPEPKKPPGRLKCGWNDNIKTNLPEIERVALTGLIRIKLGTICRIF